MGSDVLVLSWFERGGGLKWSGKGKVGKVPSLEVVFILGYFLGYLPYF